MRWAQANLLGGIMLWTLDFDDYTGSFCNMGPFPLANAIKTAFHEFSTNIFDTDPMFQMTNATNNNTFSNNDLNFIELKNISIFDSTEIYFQNYSTEYSSFNNATTTSILSRYNTLQNYSANSIINNSKLINFKGKNKTISKKNSAQNKINRSQLLFIMILLNILLIYTVLL